MAYAVEILDASANYVATIRSLAPLDSHGTILEYGRRLSNYGTARFRVATKDPLFTNLGDILKPFANHVRIKPSGTVVWQGYIINCPRRNPKYVEVEAFEYLFRLERKRIQHDPVVTAGDGKDNYKTLSSGTMATAVSTILTQVKAGSSDLIGHNLIAGTIENPNFPLGYVKADRVTALTGAWTFSTDMTLQFSYMSVLKVLKQLSLYGVCDFELSGTPATGLTFTWKKFLGTDNSNLVFTYGEHGMIEEYNVPLMGAKTANDLVGISMGVDGQVIHSNKTSPASVATYGALEDVAAYADATNLNTLVTKLNETLLFSADPSSEINISLNSNAYPLGQWNLGDIVTIKISDHIVSVNERRRIVAYDVKVLSDGSETPRLVTNHPRAGE